MAYPQVFSVGAAPQQPVPQAVHNLPSSLGGLASAMSTLIVVHGYNRIALGFIASQPGSYQIQRYIDEAGIVPQDQALGGTFNAGQPTSLNSTDNLPFGSFQITITNAGADTCYLTNLALMVQAANVNGANAPLRTTCTALESATGTIIDAAWAGTGATTMIGALKAIYNLLSGITSAGTKLIPVNLTQPRTLTADDTGITYTNQGVVIPLPIILPPAVQGLNFSLEIVAPYLMRFIASGTDVIRNGSDVSIAGGSIGSSAPGNLLKIKCNVTGQWTVENSTGDWALV